MVEITDIFSRLQGMFGDSSSSISAGEEETRIVTSKYQITRFGDTLRVDSVLPQHTPDEQVTFDDSLLERFWDLNSIFPNRAFKLRIKAVVIGEYKWI